jgi:uncharacterized membrane-anchored protein YhcB (DUF1043 family)
MNKKDLLSKLAQIYEEHEENTRPILFPSDISRQDVEAIAREIVSTIESYDVNIDKRGLEKLSKEIAEGYLFELEVDKLINRTFEEIKEKEKLDEDITLDKFIENKESEKIFKEYLNKTKEKWEKNFKLEKELKDPEKAGTFIVFQVQRAIESMKGNIKFLKDPLKIEKEAMEIIKSRKSMNEFILQIIKIKEEKTNPQNIQQKILMEKDFIGFILSTFGSANSKVKIEENELDKIRQYADTIKYETITTFKNTKHISQEAIENIEKLKQDLIKNTSELDTNKTLEDAIKHAIKLETAIENELEFFKQEIEEKKKFLSNPNKEIQKENDDTSLQELPAMIEKASKEADDRKDTIYRPIEIVNLFRITHKEEKLKNLNRYVMYHWIYKVKETKTVRFELSKILLELTERANRELDKKRRTKQEK